MVFLTRFARLLQQNGAAVNTLKYTKNLRQLHATSVFQKERRYSEKHEWVEVDGQTGVIGISQYAQEALGDVVFAQLPDPGTTLKQNDECGALESVKAASEVYSPVSGQVTEKNAAVEESPALVNTNCYDKGWLFKVNLSNPAELKNLMNEEQYKEFLLAAEH
uniref:Glycine cleavage system H protein n=1 Tax=Glossina brevipalpis TaxID=37001 RepID=A0A1A9WTF4_9MUSC